MFLTLEEAKRVAEGAIEKAKEMGLRISVAVADQGGRLVVLKRMDGAIWGSLYGCQGKVVVATGFGVPSKEISPLVETQEFLHIEGQEGGHMAAGGGAVPLFRNGVLIGAVGVGGGTGGEDEACAVAGAAKF